MYDVMRLSEGGLSSEFCDVLMRRCIHIDATEGFWMRLYWMDKACRIIGEGLLVVGLDCMYSFLFSFYKGLVTFFYRYLRYKQHVSGE
ncbi:hypothetical protein BJX70DRAFT_220962 [Aspergillus crustosus]